MIFSTDFHELGERMLQRYSQLCETPDDISDIEEAVFRTIIDRAYYSAFLTARDWLDDNDDNFNSEGRSIDHHSVRRQVTLLPNGNSLAGKLKTLRSDRNQASYALSGRLATVYDRDKVKKNLVTAELFIKEFES